MRTYENFEFQVSLSMESFIDKKISNAMIGGTNNPEVRKIREEYGYNPYCGVSFQRTTVTAHALLDAILQGKVICNLFTPKKTKKNGSFGSHQKTIENFCGSNIICVDIDHTRYQMEDFISTLTFPPTIYHTTPSHMQTDENGECKGPRYRLIYVFEETMHNHLYFKYCVNKLYDRIEKETNEIIDDRCGEQASQYFNGSCIDNAGTVVSYGLTNKIYTLEDLNVSDNDYQNYLTTCAGYESVNDKRETYIIEELKRLTGQQYYYHWNTHSFETCEPTYSSDYLKQYELKCSQYSSTTNTLLNDWGRLSLDEFEQTPEWRDMTKYNRHIKRIEKEEWIEDRYQYVDDDYFELFYNCKTLMDGDHRRKNLYQRMCLRRVMKPEITKDELVFNTIMDIIKGYDNSDGLLGEEFIRMNVDAAFGLTIERIKEIYKGTISYLKRTKKKKRKKIYKNRHAYSRERTFLKLDELYIDNLSPSQNVDYIINRLGYDDFSRTVIMDYAKTRNKKDIYKLDDKQLYEKLDIHLNKNQNYNKLKNSGYKVSKDRVKRLWDIKKDDNSSVCSPAGEPTISLRK